MVKHDKIIKKNSNGKITKTVKKTPQVKQEKITTPVKNSKESTKISSKESKKNSFLIIGIVAIVIIALLSILFIFKPEYYQNSYNAKTDYTTYNGFEFEERGNFWVTFVELNGVPYEAPFYNHPLDLEDISYDENVTAFVLGVPHAKFIIAVSDYVGSTPVLAGSNIARITGKLYGMPTSSALYATPNNRDENQTMIKYVDCTDATSTTPIFWINVNDSQQSIYLDENNPNCIIIGGRNNDEILASADLFAYKILKII